MKEGWLHIKFGDAFNLNMGKTPARADDSLWKDGIYPWVSISDMPDGKFIGATKELLSQRAVEETHIHLVPKGTVIMSFKLTIGKTAIAPYDLYTNEAIMAFEPKPCIDVLPDFLYYYLRFYRWSGNRAVMGETINKGVIYNAYADIPSLEEQERIVLELDRIAAVIADKRQQLRELDNLAQAIFYDMFGDPLTNPKGWEVKKLGEIATTITGLTYSPNDVVSEGGIIVLRSSNIQDGIIDLTDIVRVNKALKETQYVEQGDILMCSRNGSTKLVGKVARINHLNERMSWGAFMTIVRSAYNPYLLWYFRTNAFKNVLEHGKTTTVNQVTLNMLRPINLPIPPLDIVKTYAQKMEAIDEQKDLLQQSVSEFERLLAQRMEWHFA